MKNSQFIYLLFLVIFVIPACKSAKNVILQAPINQISLFQNGIETVLNESFETVEVDRKAFSLRFYNKAYTYKNEKFYSAKIAAFLNMSELDKVKTGMLMADLPCFEPGSGMAADETGKYESLYFNNSGHHYTLYENSESKRLNLIGRSGEYLKLEFEIKGLYYDKMEFKMNETKLNEFYLAFLIDRNLNGKIEVGELKKLIVKFR
ncbi:MAG: hypothetical protein SGJ00_14900 [bacterium]|nr:hypothetical protein [bacterium]